MENTHKKQTQFKIKYKLSYSPPKARDSQMQIKTKIGKKTAHINIEDQRTKEQIFQACHGISNIVHKNRNISSGMFKNARRIDQKQTFLSTQKRNMLSHTNGSSSPKTRLLSSTKITKESSGFDNIHSTNSLKLIKPSNDAPQKIIRRTISIKIEGSAGEDNQNKELITTLSRLIFEKDERQDNFQIEFMDESSIHGDELNYLELDGHEFSNAFQLL